MKTSLPRSERKRLEKALRARLDVLTQEISGELHDSEEQDYAALSGDEGDTASADVISDTRLFDLQRDVGEIDAVRAALDRIAAGTYGLCIECGEEIDVERLRAEPAAARCIDCQLRQENARLRPHAHGY